MVEDEDKEEEEEEGRGRRQATNIKSNNPHLAGGEKMKDLDHSISSNHFQSWLVVPTPPKKYEFVN